LVEVGGEGRGVGDGNRLRKEIRELGGGDGMVGVVGEVGLVDGDALNEELAIDDGTAEVGVGGDVDDGAGEEGEEFGGDIAAESGVCLFVEGLAGGGELADFGGGLSGGEVAGLGVVDLEGCGKEGGEEGGAFERASGIVGEDEGGGHGPFIVRLRLQKKYGTPTKVA